MAYGQTGSGKTFTMGSEAHTELELTESTGLIPRFMKDLFQQLSATDNLETSFLEVYGEDVHDLLDPSRASLPLREDSSGGVICTGLTTRRVTSAEQAVKVLHEGTLNRTTAATLMNLTSSRSHAVFTVTLTRPHSVKSKLTFVDLAGSERMKKTGAEGERAREGIEINKGLLALGNVINALADDERLQNATKKIHVPYRQSKLTRLLQDALGGNSQTLFLACVSAADTNASETLSTLHYANRARNIQNAPTRNVDPSVLEVQQWQAYVSVLQAELIQHKFGNSGLSPTGHISEELMKKKDVNEYLDKLQMLAQQQLTTSTTTVPVRLSSPSGQQGVSSANELLLLHDVNQSILENFDPALLDEVNPDEEMAILDQLLDLQQQDQDYDKEQKRDYQALKQVEGELVEQEQLLLQLRESLKVYHNMKAKYENLMVEVQQLELEKAQLAEQLEKASADPTLGCSRAIKKEMEMVERNLIRARNETRKHRQMYKKAEQEAQKCRVMERKIAELKVGRANLIKKQKEAAARHRELTESKTREIMALKRKDRSTERKMTKLQGDIQMHKRNLDKRQAYCKKLLEQKKQTETHLMKLLAMRQRDLRERTTRGGRREKSATDVKPTAKQDAFAPADDEIDSINFFLDKVVEETVAYAELKDQYEERVTEYSEAMRALVAAVKDLEESNEGERQELEHTIQQLELKVELSGSALETIRARISRFEADDGTEDGKATRQLIKDKSAPVLRTILIGTMDKLAEAEVSRFGYSPSRLPCISRLPSSLLPDFLAATQAARESRGAQGECRTEL
jgi:Kinesin motor domain